MSLIFNGKKADAEIEERLKTLRNGLLLHVCCGPCATAVIERILPFVKPVLYYYNPNIYPFDEYQKRYENLKKVAEYFSLPLLCEPYDENEYLDEVVGLEKEREGFARCERCFSLRLEKTAQRAKEENIGAFCTTLTVSPHKNSTIINAIGEEIAKTTGVEWIASDFKKRNGYRRSVELSDEIGLYRQNYCGCRFALGDER